MSTKRTIEQAYGNFSKETPGSYNFNWIPDFRGAKYYYLKLVRFFTR